MPRKPSTPPRGGPIGDLLRPDGTLITLSQHIRGIAPTSQHKHLSAIMEPIRTALWMKRPLTEIGASLVLARRRYQLDDYNLAILINTILADLAEVGGKPALPGKPAPCAHTESYSGPLYVSNEHLTGPFPRITCGGGATWQGSLDRKTWVDIDKPDPALYPYHRLLPIKGSDC